MNGVVILLSLSDRQISVQVGYSLEGCLNDGKVGRILDDYAIPYLSNDDFSTGLIETYKAVANVVCAEYGVELNPDYNINNYGTSDEDEGFDMVSTIIVAVIIVAIVIALFKNKGGSDGSGGTYHDGGSHYGPTYRGGYSGGSSGGFSGGGFSGGGGSFGGGGSSRGF